MLVSILLDVQGVQVSEFVALYSIVLSTPIIVVSVVTMPLGASGRAGMFNDNTSLSVKLLFLAFL